LVRKNNLEILFVISLLVLIPLVSAGVFQDIIFHINGSQDSEQIGFVMHGGYDFNGDGYNDFLFAGGASEDVFLMYGGSAGGFPKNVTDHFAIANVTNVTFQSSFSNSEFGSTPTNDQNGAVFIGDWNNDTYADVMISASSADVGGLTNNGQVYIFFGNSNPIGPPSAWNAANANITINGSFDDGYLGGGYNSNSVALGFSKRDFGDFNGDGIVDIIVPETAFDNNSGLINTKALHLIYGVNRLSSRSDATTIGQIANITFISPFHNTTAGQSGMRMKALFVGDINNDSLEDLAISFDDGDGGGNERGEVYIYLGNFTNIYPTVNITINAESANITINGSANSLHLVLNGYIGDWNNDTIDDMAFAEPLLDINGLTAAGRILIMLGQHGLVAKDAKVSEVANLTINGVVVQSNLGHVSRTVIGADINNDGINDLIIPNPRGTNINLGTNQTNIVFGIHGFTGVVTQDVNQSNMTINGSAIEGSVDFGVAVEVWDYDNDSINELIVGDRNYNGIGTNRGKIYGFELLDNSEPSLIVNGPANVTYGSTNVSLNVSVHDRFGTGSLSGVSSCWYSLNGTANVSFTCLSNTTFVTNDCAQHNVTVYSNDTANNVNQSSNVVFSIYTSAATCNPTTTTTTSTAGTGGGSSGSTVATVKSGEVKAIGRLSAVGTNREMSAGAIVSFELPNEETHTAKVLSVDKEKQEVEVEVSSTPQKIKIKVGETVDVDLTDDGKAEIGVTLIEINEKGNALLNFIRYGDRPVVKRGAALDEALEANDDTINSVGNALGKLADGEVKDAVKATPWWLWLLIVLVIVGAGVWYYINKMRY